MVILFHGDDPRHIVKGDEPQAEVGVIRDAANLPDKRVEIGRLDAVDGRDEVGRGQAVLVCWRSTALQCVSSKKQPHTQGSNIPAPRRKLRCVSCGSADARHGAAAG